MVNNKYGIAYSEILEILKHIPIEDYNKIPKSEIELFKAYADDNYTFTYDSTKTLAEQNVSDITKGLIILLFRDYWATEIQRNKIIAKQNYDRIKLEEEKDKSDNESKADLIVAVGTGEVPYIAIAGSILLIMISITAGIYVIKKKHE